MNKNILIVLLILCFCKGISIAGTGRTYGYRNITSSGTTGISFDHITKEITVICYSTNTVTVNWVSSYTITSSDFRMQRIAVTAEPDKHTEEVESSYMSVNSSYTPVDVRVQWKMWR